MDQPTTNFIYFLAVIGGLYFIVFLAKLLWSCIKSILPSKNYQQRYGENSWAVITGGSDGIGLGFCEELAALGFNICMIARNREKMDTALKRIKDQNSSLSIQTMLIVADFTQSQSEGFFERIMQQLEGKDISMLINNVGISNVGRLHEVAPQRLMNEINVNVVSMTMMTRYIVPLMLQRQRRSAIINISSLAGQHPLPYLSVYSGTKVYNDFFSQAIDQEYERKIDVLSVRPMHVSTNMTTKPKSLTVASRNQCAAASLKYLGIDYETNGYYMHRLMAYIVDCLPKAMLRYLGESATRKVMQEESKKN